MSANTMDTSSSETTMKLIAALPIDWNEAMSGAPQPGNFKIAEIRLYQSPDARVWVCFREDTSSAEAHPTLENEIAGSSLTAYAVSLKERAMAALGKLSARYN